MLYCEDHESDQNGVGEKLVLNPRLCRSSSEAVVIPASGRVRDRL